MLYWTCAQLEHNRTQLVLHCLALRGFEVYHPRLRVHRRSFGHKILTTPPLFPGSASCLLSRDGGTHVGRPALSALCSMERGRRVSLIYR